jgi:hypothetical protein
MEADMRPLDRPQRIAVMLWIVMATVVWNAVYDLTVGQGIKEYLFRNALYQAGRGPHITVASVMDVFVFRAVWVSTIWASVIMLAGLFTIRLFSTRRPDHPGPWHLES